MARARITFSPVNSQQRPLDFWSLMPREGTLCEKCVSLLAGLAAERASWLMLVPAMALLMARSAGVVETDERMCESSSAVIPCENPQFESAKRMLKRIVFLIAWSKFYVEFV